MIFSANLAHRYVHHCCMGYFESFISRRFTFQARRPFSRLIVNIAIAGIALGLAIMICSVAIMSGFKGTIRDKVRGFGGDLQISRLNENGGYENAPFIWNSSLQQKTSSLPGVTRITPFATIAGILSLNGEIEGVLLKGLSANYNHSFYDERLVSGKGLNLNADSVSADIMVPRVIAERLRVKTGDHVIMYFIQNPVRTRKLHVTGIYDLGMDELDKTFVLGDIRLVRKLKDWVPGQCAGVQVDLADFNALERSQKQLNRIMPVTLKVYTIKQLYAQLFDWLSLTDVNVQVILVLMVLVAGINMVSALLIMILERTATIGILKALGSSDSSVRRIFLSVATYLIGLGLLFGNLIGLGFCLIQAHWHLVALNPETYYMSYVPIRVSWLSVLEINAGTLVVCFLMLLVPSYLITRINPIRAIRFK